MAYGQISPSCDPLTGIFLQNVNIIYINIMFTCPHYHCYPNPLTIHHVCFYIYGINEFCNSQCVATELSARIYLPVHGLFT